MVFVLEIICLKQLTNGAYAINLDKYADVGKHWVTLYVLNKEVIHFESFGFEHVPKEIMHFVGHKIIKANIFRIKTNSSIMNIYVFHS